MADNKDNISEIDFLNTVSTTECTGLTPTIPEDITEAESYNDIYRVPVKKGNPNKKRKQQKKDS